MQFDRTTYRRIIGVTTAAYGLAVLTRPRTLLGPAALPETGTNTNLARAVGARDVASGIALVAASPQQARPAVLARVAADASDVVVFGALCPRRTKLKAAAIAAGYGALCSLALPRD